MIWWLVILVSLPLVLYAAIEYRWGLKAGVIGAMVLGVLEFFFAWLYLGIFDPSIMFAIFLLAALGALSLGLKSPTFLRLHPALMSMGFAAVLFYFQYWDEPLVAKYMDRIKDLPEMKPYQEVIANPQIVELFTKSCEDLIYVFILHAFIMVYCAFRSSRMVWLFWQLIGIWILIFAAVFIRFRMTTINL